MNEQLIKFIELCLMDGVVTDKEREVIFRKSKEFGVPEDECEIILEGMIQKHSNKNTSQPQKKKGFFGSIMDEVKKGVDEVKKNIDVDSITDKVNSFREEYEKKVEELRTKTSSIGHEEEPHLNTTSSEELKEEEIEIQVEEKVKEEPLVDLSTDDFKENETLGSEKVEESIEVLKEEISNDLIRIITKGTVGFYCFEFKTDSIKVFDLKNIFDSDKIKGSPCFIEQFDEKLDKVLDEELNESNFKVEDGEILYEGEDFVKKLRDFYIYSDSYTSRFTDKVTKYIDIRYQDVYNDGSGGIGWLGKHMLPDQLSKVEKIVYLFNNITSHKDMVSLNESYLKYNSKIVEEKKLFINELDVDGNGVIDISENTDFSKLLKTKQKILIEFEKSEGKSYVQNFIKLSKFLIDKSQNIQSLFEKLKEEESNIPHSDYLDYVGIIRNQIHTYNLMLISSLNMIVSLVDDDRITFYEIYETFDKLNVFSSNHEKEVSMKLDNIENKLEGVIQSIHEMEINICNELMNLQFVSEDISEGINGLSKGLSEINSQLNTNNILTGIQTYQLYKINKNTRGLR